MIAHQRLGSKMLDLWIKNSLTTDAKFKLRDFNYAYTLNVQDDGSAMLFVILKWCDLIHVKDDQTSIISWKNEDVPFQTRHHQNQPADYGMYE